MGSLRPTGGGGMGMLRPTGGGGMEMLRTTGGMVAAMGWECFALPAAGWDGIATSYRQRRDGNVMPYRRHGGMGMLRPTGGRVGWDCYA